MITLQQNNCIGITHVWVIRSIRLITIFIKILNLLMSLDQNTAIRRASFIRKESIQYNFHILLEP